jgi:hypothetical protein
MRPILSLICVLSLARPMLPLYAHAEDLGAPQVANIVASTRAVERARVETGQKLRARLARHPSPADRKRIDAFLRRLKPTLSPAIQRLKRDPEDSDAWTKRGEIWRAVEEADAWLLQLPVKP